MKEAEDVRLPKAMPPRVCWVWPSLPAAPCTPHFPLSIPQEWRLRPRVLLRLVLVSVVRCSSALHWSTLANLLIGHTAESQACHHSWHLCCGFALGLMHAQSLCSSLWPLREMKQGCLDSRNTKGCWASSKATSLREPLTYQAYQLPID